jgi:energy-coupling factor transporter ATP-binding protein EcfA2
MKLLRFRVENFRSVEDSDWIEADDVTALIGTNESGKTNILLPLWKLNPAKEGDIDLTSDYPRKNYNTFRTLKDQPTFITAVFDVGDDLAGQLEKISGVPAAQMREASIARSFDGNYVVDFPAANPPRSVGKGRVADLLSQAEMELATLTPLKSEEDLKNQVLVSISGAKNSVSGLEQVDGAQLENLLSTLVDIPSDETRKTSTLVPRYQRLRDDVRSLKAEISHVHPRDVDAATDLVLEKMPKFVYYSNYGNLDSEIYLPYVIQNMSRTDLGAKEQAKTRTLKVLFEFVKLRPQEILELGKEKEPLPNQPPLTAAQIAEVSEKKRQRSILLQSASTELTKRFRDWWKQGDYRFRFEADGNHFRIWVSDDKRPEEIELEGRSTGLQWFLSFYLVFLVERADAHADAILLLDEPGISLHPLAQRDLSAFFDSLAIDNQLIYTSHSPFLIDADRLDRARKVYVGDNGTSKVTADLSRVDGNSERRGSAYAVYASLGLTVAESLLIGCVPVVVEGPSDQHYLTTIKTILVSAGKLKMGRELIFPPAGGTKGVKAVASILGGRDEELPVTLFDSDVQGKATAKTLKTGLYCDQPHLVLEVATYAAVADSEIEDLIPPELIARELDRWLRPDARFEDQLQKGKPVVPQIEAWAQQHGVELQKPGWKVELAKRVKQRLLADGVSSVPQDYLDRWEKLFSVFQNVRSTSSQVESVKTTKSK